MAAVEHLVGRRHDGIGLVLRQLAERAVDGGRGALDLASAAISSGAIFSVEMWKWCRERWVWAPQSWPAGTSIGPKLSFSMRLSIGLSCYLCRRR